MSNLLHGAPSGAAQEPLDDPSVRTPTHAERARTLAAARRSGTLSTLAEDPAGTPYGSLVTTVLQQASPIFLLSALAEHTKNLRADDRASILLAEGGDDNPLALGRVSLLGRCRPIAPSALAEPRELFLAAHPDARHYIDYKDFALYRLEVSHVRYIGGFGRMSWVSTDAWEMATPDPIAPIAPGILAHMNEDHGDALISYCRAFTRAREFSDVVMTGVDRYGFEMSIQTPDGRRPIRLAFDAEVATSDDVRRAMVRLVKKAREVLGESAEGSRA